MDIKIAPSFEKNYTIESEPFEKNGKLYIKIKHKNTGNLRDARAYTAEEHAKIYGRSNTAASDSKPAFGSQKGPLGFEKGYITVILGNTEPYKIWLKENKARYCRFWGWYIISTDELPTEIPSELKLVTLNWSDVGQDNGYLKPEKEVETILNKILYPETNTKFIGNIGDRLEFYLIVDKVCKKEGYYGVSYYHIMHDIDNNIFIWSTAKMLEEGKEYHLRATIKDQNIYKGNRQNIITRAQEI